MAETERADPTMLAISQAEQLTRVLLRFVQPADASQHFTTIGVGANPTDAVMEALRDGALHILLPAPLANNVATSLATAAH